MFEKILSRAVARIPGANIKEFLGTIRSEPKWPQIPRLSKDWEFSERKAADQKFFSVSGMGFGQQPPERRRASFFETSRERLKRLLHGFPGGNFALSFS
jgi:hypothetical protein